MTYDICVVGSEVLVYPFLQFGFATYTPKDNRDLREYLEEVIARDYGIIYIEDAYCFGIEDILDRYMYAATPIFVPIGETAEGTSYSTQMMEKLMERAIGFNIARVQGEE